MRSVTSSLLFFAAALIAAAAPDDTAGSSAVELFKARRYAEAQTAFERLVAAEPQNASAHYYLGALALRRNDFDTAIAQLEQATTLDPTNSDYFANLGSAYGSAAQRASFFAKSPLARKCLAALLKAVELDPNNLDARDGLVSYYRQAPGFVGGSMEKAYGQAEEIRQRDPIRGALVLSAIYTSEKKYDQAFAAIDAARQVQPRSYLALYAFGRVAAESGQRLDEGAAALRACLELTPPPGAQPHASVHWRLGVIAQKQGELATARTEFEAALKLDPGFRLAQDALTRLPSS